MKSILLIGLACLAPVTTCLPVNALAHGQTRRALDEYGPLVKRQLVDGRPRLTVITEDSPAKELLRLIAQQYELEIIGLNNLGNSLISVHLEGRDLNNTLQVILGSLGLQHKRLGGVLEIMPIEEHTGDELFAMADSAWADFHRRFPTHPMAPHAQFSRAEIKEKQGSLSAARDLYLQLVKDYPASMELGPALLRAGFLSAKQGDHAQASQIFRRLSNMDVSDSLQAATRLELARVLIDQGDPAQALNLIKSMEVDYPPMDQPEATVRRLIRARALNKLGKYVDAMREIDLLDNNFDDLAAWESLHIRANAFDGMGLHADASRAWLLYATEAIGKQRNEAYASAARLALLANDEMAVLFIAATAQKDGLDQGLALYVNEAKQRLGILESEPAQKTELSSTLDEAQAIIDAGEILRAMNILGPLFRTRAGIAEIDQRARLSVAWARCIEDQEGLDPAIQLLASERLSHSTNAELGLLDIAAAKLFEKHNLFVEATKAYQGEYGQ